MSDTKYEGSQDGLKQCPKCDCYEYEDIVVDTIQFSACETERICKGCGFQFDYWAFGWCGSSFDSFSGEDTIDDTSLLINNVFIFDTKLDPNE